MMKTPMNRLTILLLLLTCYEITQANNFIEADSFHVQTYNCNEPADICIEIPLTELPNYQIFQDGQPYSNGIAGCDFDTIITYTYNTLFGQGALGPYHVDAWKVNNITYSGDFNTIDALVDSMNIWDPSGTWIHESGVLLISGGNPMSTYGNMEITALMNGSPSVIGFNFGLDAQGTQLNFDVGEYEIIMIDQINNMSDTFTVIVECMPMPQPFTFYDTIQADQNPYVLCIDTTELPGTVDTIYNACPDSSGTFINFSINEDTYCVKYQGTKCDGEETACIVVCDDMGFCDTTFMNIVVDNTICEMESQLVVDSILINFSDTFCLDTTELPGNIVNVENACPDESGMSVDFEVDEDTYCVTYFGISEGKDEACFVLTDHYGNTDTTYFCIFVTLPETGTIIDSLACNDTVTYCLQTDELVGNTFSIENSCENLSGSSVNFTINPISLCIDVESFASGTESACIIICDEFSVCDTTLLTITVGDDCVIDPCDNEPPPLAFDDRDSTFKNTPVTISVLDNDTIPPCSPSDITILDEADGGVGPLNGMVMINSDGTLNYIPNFNFCGTDSFNYVLCNMVGCDTALVIVEVDCIPDDEILVYDGFSPNGDGTNDTFTIENIENFPDNEVVVYNRWGSLVFKENGYMNTWNGGWNGKILPSGTYFYSITIDSGRQKFSGFLQLNR